MTAPSSFTVLVDLSPLDTPSRLRGIGQYVMGLARGLQELDDTEHPELDFGALAHFDWRGRSTGTDSLAYKGQFIHPDSKAGGRYRFRKRHGLGRAADARGANLLHITEPLALPRKCHVPIVLTCHDLIPIVLHRDYLGSMPWALPLRLRRERQNFALARRVIAVSEATRRDLVEYLDIPIERIDVAHLGVDHTRFTPEPEREDELEHLRKRYGIERPYCLYLGAFDQRKGVDELIRAFAQTKLSCDCDLLLAGAIRKKRQLGIEALISQHHLEGKVRLLGFIDDADVPILYRNCLIHIFPSSYEGFGLPVAEAMACGAPTITTTASSLPEVAGDGALLVPPKNEEALREALVALCHSESERARLKEAGTRRAATFQWRHCAERTVESYRKALADREGR